MTKKAIILLGALLLVALSLYAATFSTSPAVFGDDGIWDTGAFNSYMGYNDLGARYA